VCFACDAKAASARETTGPLVQITGGNGQSVILAGTGTAVFVPPDVIAVTNGRMLPDAIVTATARADGASTCSNGVAVAISVDGHSLVVQLKPH
jgi:hypothetical protein